MGGACGGQEGRDDTVIDSSGVEDFVKALRSAVTQLLTKLNIPLERVTARFIQHTHSQSFALATNSHEILFHMIMTCS